MSCPSVRTLSQKPPTIARFAVNWEEVVARSDIDIVIVATSHDLLAPIAAAAAANSKHVLIEKLGPYRRGTGLRR
jgi:predicted dehydrogenase